MTDVWNVSASYDKPSYNKGEVIKVSITGGLTSTTTTSVPGGTLTQTIAAGGSTTTITTPPTTINTTTTATQTAKLTGIVDTSSRVWTIAVDGLSATTIA